MNDIIKSIEEAQLKSDITPFSVGDTIKVYAKVKEGNRERTQVFEGTVIKRQNGGARETFTATVKHLQLERVLTVSVLRRHGHFIPQSLRRLKLQDVVK